MTPVKLSPTLASMATETSKAGTTMTTLHVCTWAPSVPSIVTVDTQEVPAAIVPEYLARKHTDAIEWGVSYAAYDAGTLPWPLLAWYDATQERGMLPPPALAVQVTRYADQRGHDVTWMTAAERDGLS